MNAPLRRKYASSPVISGLENEEDVEKPVQRHTAKTRSDGKASRVGIIRSLLYCIFSVWLVTLAMTVLIMLKIQREIDEGVLTFRPEFTQQTHSREVSLKLDLPMFHVKNDDIPSDSDKLLVSATSPDGKEKVVAVPSSEKGTEILLYTTESIRKLEGRFAGNVEAISFSPDGSQIAAAFGPDGQKSGGIVRVWRRADGKIIRTEEKGEMKRESDPRSPSDTRNKASSRAPAGFPKGQTKKMPKIAFLFLIVFEVQTEEAWQNFFGAEAAGKCSIHMYSHPNATLPRESMFAGTRKSFPVHMVEPRYVVRWGTTKMVKAELQLIASALHDESNQRFVLVSDTCVPLWPFECMYHFLMSHERSFVETAVSSQNFGIYDFPKDYAQELKRNWRKGSQWFVLTRVVAAKIAANMQYYDIFGKSHNTKDSIAKHDGDYHPSFADEHYIQTMIGILGLQAQVLPVSLTFARMGPYDEFIDWGPIDGDASGAHPAWWHAVHWSAFPRDLMQGLQSACRYNVSQTVERTTQHRPRGTKTLFIYQGREYTAPIIPSRKYVRSSKISCDMAANAAPCFFFLRKVTKEGVHDFVTAYSRSTASRVRR